mmetsp:Transcript_39461/g.85894  ORF Transcript_39461/g.85894 Transcript_39461/m.85894 type:complete len:266 (-) Transcript_39461:1141-1938(-)
MRSSTAEGEDTAADTAAVFPANNQHLREADHEDGADYRPARSYWPRLSSASQRPACIASLHCQPAVRAPIAESLPHDSPRRDAASAAPSVSPGGRVGRARAAGRPSLQRASELRAAARWRRQGGPASRCGRSEPPRPPSLEEHLDGGLVVHPPDGLPEEVGHGEHRELREGFLVLVGDGHGVGDYHLLKQPRGEPLHRGGAEHRVGRARNHRPRALFLEEARAAGEGARCVDHVVYHNCYFAVHLAYQVHHLRLVVGLPPLVDDG